MSRNVTDTPVFRKSLETRPSQEISIFLEGLAGADRSLEKRAFSAKFIARHRADIDTYLQRSNIMGNLSGVNHVNKLRRLVELYGEMPAGYDFDLKTATLKQNPGFFSMEPPFTRKLGSGFSRAAKYVLSAAITAGLIYLSWEVANLGASIIRTRADNVQSVIGDSYGEK